MSKKEYGEDLYRITFIEVIQGQLHALKNALEASYLNSSSLKDALRKGNISVALERQEQIEGRLDEISNIIESISDISHIGKDDVVMFSLYDALAEVVSMVDYNLKLLNINVEIQCNQTVTVKLYKDAILHAFLNLFINSIDSFKLTRKKRNRKIYVRIVKEGEIAKVTYSDSGVGFIPNPPEITEINDIWKVGSTTKGNGSGHGLPLASHFFEEICGGSINVVDYRNGMTFLISLPCLR